MSIILFRLSVIMCVTSRSFSKSKYLFEIKHKNMILPKGELRDVHLNATVYTQKLQQHLGMMEITVVTWLHAC